ncbi:MAG: hypothetical protein O3C21_20110 [Verrucomicrobia bacterium]|nr:hypothetical protein [Verrucomicrobiota bacterium]
MSEVREQVLTAAFAALAGPQRAAFGILTFTDVLKKNPPEAGVRSDWEKVLVPNVNTGTRWPEGDWVSRKQQWIPFIMQRLRSSV